MMKQIYKNNFSVNYKDIGRGPTIVLIHGFLETLDIWNNFDTELSKYFRVISVDLPGHGQSDLHNEPYTMCKYAESVKNVLEEENIETVFLIGHSMGGYVSLAFSENYPQMISGLCLFHSSPFSDDENNKITRDTTVERINTGELDNICETHVRLVYAPDNTKVYIKNIEEAEKNAKQISDKSVIASILTIRDRNDRSNVLKELNVPFLYILGMKDNFISTKIIHEIEMPKKFLLCKLENSGHMGMVEEKEKSLKLINDFYKNYISSE